MKQEGLKMINMTIRWIYTQDGQRFRTNRQLDNQDGQINKESEPGPDKQRTRTDIQIVREPGRIYRQIENQDGFINRQRTTTDIKIENQDGYTDRQRTRTDIKIHSEPGRQYRQIAIYLYIRPCSLSICISVISHTYISEFYSLLFCCINEQDFQANHFSEYKHLNEIDFCSVFPVK